MTDLDAIKDRLLQFRQERNWQQFHTLKNLIVSVNLEAAELLELTQWKSDADLAALRDDPAFRHALQDECADVLLYLLLVAADAGFDLAQAAHEKIDRNAVRYPVDQAYGSAKKYTKLAAASELPKP